MKTIILLLSTMMALFVMSCSTTHKVTESTCHSKDSIAFYVPGNLQFSAEFKEDCYTETIYPQKEWLVENGETTDLIASKIKGYYKLQTMKLADLEMQHEAKIFTKSKNGTAGQIGASIEGWTSNNPSKKRTVFSDYSYLAVFTTDELTEKSFVGELLYFNSFIEHKGKIYPMTSSNQGMVPKVFTYSKGEYENVYLRKENRTIERVFTDSSDYYIEYIVFEGTAEELLGMKNVQHTTEIGGIYVKSPKEEVAEYREISWRVVYEKTPSHEKSLIYKNGDQLVGVYTYDVSTKTLFNDTDGNGYNNTIYEHGKMIFESEDNNNKK